MKLIIFNLLIILSVNRLYSQDLSYLNKVGTDLANDIKNGSTTAYINDSTLNVFLRKAVISKLKGKKSEDEKLKLIKESSDKIKAAYISTAKKTKSLLTDNGFLMDEFDLWSNIPLSKEVIDSSTTAGTSSENAGRLMVLNCMFMLGDLDKRIVIDATVIVHGNTYSIIEISKPVTFFTFLMDQTYGVMYLNVVKILETTLVSSSSMSRLTSGNPLVGEKHDEEWNKCTVQLFDENIPTLIKLNANSKSMLSTPKAEIKASIFEEVSSTEGLRHIKDILGVFAQEFTIRTSEENNFSSDKRIKVFTDQALHYDKRTKTTTASLQLKDGSFGKTIYTVKLVMYPGKKDSYKIDLYLVEK